MHALNSYDAVDSSDDEQPSPKSPRLSTEPLQTSKPTTNAIHNIQPEIETQVNSTFGERPQNQTPNNSISLTPQKNKYAVPRSQLPDAVINFLAQLRTYFLKEVNLLRVSGPIAPSTFDKAEERLLCEY